MDSDWHRPVSFNLGRAVWQVLGVVEAAGKLSVPFQVSTAPQQANIGGNTGTLDLAWRVSSKITGTPKLSCLIKMGL